jgi:hypothetical protein
MTPALSQLRNVFPEERRTPEQDALIGQSCLALSKGERQCVVELLNSRQTLQTYRRDVSGVNDRIHQAIGSGKTIGLAIGVTGGAIVGGVAGGLATMHTGPLMPFLMPPAIVGGMAVVGTAGGLIGHTVGGKWAEKHIVGKIEKSEEFIRWRTQKCAYVALPVLRQFAHIEADSHDARTYAQQLEALRENYNLRVDQQRRVFDAHRIGVDPVERDRVVQNAHMTEQEAHQVVDFYGRTSVQRADVSYVMMRDIIGSDMPDEKKDFLVDFLSSSLIRDPVKI